MTRIWTPQAATCRLVRLTELAAMGSSAAIMREIGELTLLLYAPVLGSA